MVGRNPTRRHWCFTSFDPILLLAVKWRCAHPPGDPTPGGPVDDEDLEAMAAADSRFVPIEAKCRYFVCQVEKAPTSDREHVQGYLALRTAARMGSVKTLLKDQTVHLEPMKGTSEEARDYCMKEDTRVCGPLEIGAFDFAQGAVGVSSSLWMDFSRPFVIVPIHVWERFMSLPVHVDGEEISSLWEPERDVVELSSDSEDETASRDDF
jgi:hypothetical protein